MIGWWCGLIHMNAFGDASFQDKWFHCMFIQYPPFCNTIIVTVSSLVGQRREPKAMAGCHLDVSSMSGSQVDLSSNEGSAIMQEVTGGGDTLRCRCQSTTVRFSSTGSHWDDIIKVKDGLRNIWLNQWRVGKILMINSGKANQRGQIVRFDRHFYICQVFWFGHLLKKSHFLVLQICWYKDSFLMLH